MNRLKDEVAIVTGASKGIGREIAAALSVEDITEESVDAPYNTNVLGSILTVQEAITRFGPEGGSIINLSRVNAIAPGHTETEGDIAAGTFGGGAGAVLAGKTPLGRLGRVMRHRTACRVPRLRRISVDHEGGHPRCGRSRDGETCTWARFRSRPIARIGRVRFTGRRRPAASLRCSAHTKW